MPSMKATGTNTATIANVVAVTAKPISLVPSRAASRWFLPIAKCRTMFSRTTIASSINNPMHSDKAIKVKKFNVKPNTCKAINVAMTEIGKVRPVIIVLRHECRNKNTIKIVSNAPSIIVSLTRSSEPLTSLALSNTV